MTGGRGRSTARRAAALVAVLTITAAACGSSPHHRAGPVSTPRKPLPIPQPVVRDDWMPPSTAGSPSAGTFCRLLIATFEHVQENAIATTPAVRTQIVEDFVRFTPTVVAAAPPDISAAASTYLGGIAQVLAVLAAHDFDAAKAPRGSIGNVVFDPKVTAAEAQLRTWGLAQCRYDITSDGV